MSNLEIRVADLREIAMSILPEGDKIKKSIELDPRNLFNLIGLKKNIENEFQKVQDTIGVIIANNDGKVTPGGEVTVPENRQEDFLRAFSEVIDHTICIEYTPIEIGSGSLPVEIMEAFFPFIEV